MRIEDKFVIVPETVIKGGISVPSFEVGQYRCTNLNGTARVLAKQKPWRVSRYDDAVAACDTSGYKLLSEMQYRALVANIEQQSANKTPQGRMNVSRPWFMLTTGAKVFDLVHACWITMDANDRTVSAEPIGFRCVK